MKKSVFVHRLLSVISLLFIIGCSNPVDINNESAVMKDIQGTWIVCQNIGNAYRHIKLSVSDNLFEAWIQQSDSEKEPTWAKIPDEKGLLTLSSLLSEQKNELKYRKFSLTCDGRCCGDKSLSVKTISELITYQESEGLVLEGKVKMIKK